MTAPPTGRRVAFFGGSFDPPHLGHLAIARAARDAFRLDTVLFTPVGAQPLKPEGSSASFEHRLAMTRLAIEGQPGFEVSLADAPKPSGGRGLTPNYTIDTLVALRTEFKPDCALYCLMGADSFFGLRRWHRAAEIPYAAALIVASRPGQPLEDLKSALPHGLTLEPAPDQNALEQNALEIARNEPGVSEFGVAVRAFLIVNPAGDRAPFYVLPGLNIEISGTDIRQAIRKASPPSPNIGASSATQPGSGAVQTMLPVAVADYIRANGLYR
ncbi:MAG: nicotinate (nicotinamide) nucleotide adenylyltransferase [Terracidiphilus sp.]